MSRIALAIIALSLLFMPVTGRAATPTQQLEANILNNMREEIELTQEVYKEIGVVVILLPVAEVTQLIKAIGMCHDAASANNIITKINRVNFIQQTLPGQISSLRNLNGSEAQHFLNSRSYTSLQNKMRQLENMPRTAQVNACRARQKQPPSTSCNCHPPNQLFYGPNAGNESAAATNAYARCMNLCYQNGGVPPVPGGGGGVRQ